MNNLRALRKEKRLTLVELSEKVNINKTSIARYETGEVEMKADVLQMFASFFNVSTDYLLGKTDDRLPTPTSSPKDQLQGIKLALYNQTEELTEEQMEDVLKFVEFIKNKDK